MTKKIMFSDKYGLTQAVLEGRKTQTRRLLTLTLHEGDLHGDLKEVCPDKVFRCVNRWMFEYKGNVYDIPTQNYPKYSVGEIVAVAQSYRSIGYQPTDKTAVIIGNKIEFIEFQNHKGWNNKMFVSPDNMMNFIRITNVRIERLQDISDEDCLAEGVIKLDAGQKDIPFYSYKNAKKNDFDTPRVAYASLIDKVSGKGTWQNNPYVFVYDFELIK